MKKRLVMGLALVLCVAMMLCACAPAVQEQSTPPADGAATSSESPVDGTTDAAKKGYTIGLSQEGLDHSYMITQRAQIQAAVDDYNQKNADAQITLICTDGQNNVETQANGIMDMLSQGIDLLMIEASDGEGLKTALAEVEAKKIPYMFVGKPMGGTNAVTMVNNDNYTIGKMAGEWTVNYLKEKNGDVKGSIAVIRGISGDQSAEDRNNGFLEVINQYPDVKIATNIDGNYRRDKSYSVMQDILQSNPEGTIDVLYAASGETGIGAALATDEAGRKGEFPIISIDGDQASIDSIKADEMSVAWTYEPCGTAGFEVALKILGGEKVDKQVIVESRQIDKSNADTAEPAF